MTNDQRQMFQRRTDNKTILHARARTYAQTDGQTDVFFGSVFSADLSQISQSRSFGTFWTVVTLCLNVQQKQG